MENWDMIFSAILLFLMWVTAFLLRLLEGSWLGPGSLMSMLWATNVSATLLLRPQYPVTNTTILLVLFFIMLFGTGSFLGQTNPWGRTLRIKRVAIEPKFPFLPVICLVLSLLSIIPSILLIVEYSGTLSGLDLIRGLENISRQETIKRYTGVGTPAYPNLFLIFVYLNPLLGGLLFVRNGRVVKTMSFLTILPAVLLTFLTGAKAATIFAGIFWLSTYFSVGFYKCGLQFRFLTKLRSLVFVILLLAAVMFFTYSQSVRYSLDMTKITNIEKMLERMDSYFFCSLPPLSSWIDNNNLLESRLGLGRWTLSGVYDFVGLAKRETGIYKEFVIFGAYASNIYTIFRGLIQDFSLPGAALLIMLAGIIAGRYFKLLLAGNMSGLILLPAIYSLIFWSPFVSIFNYNSVLMAFGGFAVYIFVCIQKENDSVSGLHRSSTNLIKSRRT